MTGGYCLPARFIIHTVGPVWEGGGYDEAGTLRRCYESSLALAAEHGFASIAFPCIATGSYEFPQDLACEIAIDSVRDWLGSHEYPREVLFCCFDESDADFYRDRLAETKA